MVLASNRQRYCTWGRKRGQGQSVQRSKFDRCPSAVAEATTQATQEGKPAEIAISGATGLLGRRLIQRALHKYSVRVLARDEAKARRQIAQRGSYSGSVPRRVQFFGPGEWSRGVSGADAVVNLCGRSLVTRWNEEVKSEIELSRIRSTERLVSLINGMSEERRPNVLVNASAVGVYGDMTSMDELRDESSRIGDRENDFLVRVCCNWEEASFNASCRSVQARMGIVLSNRGGALASMTPAFQLGGGGPIGPGYQPVSWVERTDAVDLLLAAIENESFRGTMNVCAPNPVDMNELAASLGRALLRPSWATVPAPVVRLLLGEGAKVVTEGQRVYPKRAIEQLGFTFQHETVQSALDAIYPNTARDRFLRNNSTSSGSF